MTDKTPKDVCADYLIDLHTTLVRMKKDDGFDFFFEKIQEIAEDVERHLCEHGLITDRVFTREKPEHDKMLLDIHRRLMIEEIETGFVAFDDGLYQKGMAIEAFLQVHYPEKVKNYFLTPAQKG